MKDKQDKSIETDFYNKDGSVNYDELERQWLNSDFSTIKSFKRHLSISDNDFIKNTRGWVLKKRALKYLYEEKIDDVNEAKKRLEFFWCDLLYRLGKCKNVSESTHEEIKHIAAMASALKVIHAGMGQLSILDNTETPPSFFVEGVDIEKL